MYKMLPERALKRNPYYRKSLVGKFLHYPLHGADIIISVVLYGPCAAVLVHSVPAPWNWTQDA
jgi:hypothetical protein